MQIMRKLATGSLILGMVGFPACSQAGPDTNLNQSDIEKIVHDYILEHPEIIEEALLKLDSDRDWKTIKDNKQAIYSNPLDVSIGPKNAPVTIVEFFDYNCGYCKRSTEWVLDTIKDNPKTVQVIFKELPILDSAGGTSKNAALAALAAHKQGKYLEMHKALMETSGLSDTRINETAKRVGVNVEQMRKDMKDPKLAAHLEDNIMVAREIRPLSGTPFFIINDDFMAGADQTRLEEMLDKAKG